MKLRMPPTLLFGSGVVAETAAVLREIGAVRPLVMTDAGVAATGLPARVCRDLAAAGVSCGFWDGIEPDPDERHADGCARALRDGGHDSVVAIGGGSVIDAAKVAAALATNGGEVADLFGFDRVGRPGLPLVAVPTTAGSGAEVSSHAVIARLASRHKEVVASVHLLPRAAIVDPDATATLPPALTAYSALDGLIHAVEAFLARRASPLTDVFAREAVPRILRALPRVLAEPGDGAAREELSLGCLYSGIAMANANAGAIHALGYPLTNRYGIPHGLANALMAAPALRYCAARLPARYAELDRLLEHQSGERGDVAGRIGDRLADLLARVGIADTLAGRGVVEGDLPDLAEAATHYRPVLDNTPVVLTREDLLAVYRAAWTAASLPG